MKRLQHNGNSYNFLILKSSFFLSSLYIYLFFLTTVKFNFLFEFRLLQFLFFENVKIYVDIYPLDSFN